jgi:drug/metabolite transporter (DMT)-like permease
VSTADAVLERSDRTTLVAFGVTVLLGAGNPIAIRLVSCETCELGPFQAAAIRFLLAGAILGIVALSIGAPFPHGRGLRGSLLFGVLQFGIGFACIYYGYARTPAGVGQVLQACIPLLTFLFAIAHRQERFRWEGLVGSLLAIVGIAVVFGSGIDAGVPLASMVAILVGAAVWSESLVVARAFPQAHPTAMGAIAMAIGTVILLALSVATGETWSVPVERTTWLAQAYLVVPGGVVVLWMILLVLRRWPASAASYQLVMITIVTVVLAAWLLDERLTWTFALGAMLVLAGVYIGALRGRAPLRSAAREAGP